MKFEKKLTAISLNIKDYPAYREKFFKDNNNIRVIEEIKTLYTGIVKQPHPTIIGRHIENTEMLINWAIIYNIKVK